METPKSTSDHAHELTGLLQRMRHGDQGAAETAVELVYGELHRIASRELRRERAGHLLQTTALIHEAYVRLVQADSLDIQNRSHFFAIASRQMRRVLVDYARRSNAQRRGGGTVCIGLDGVQAGFNPPATDVVVLDEALR
jgi:RNA polymerase sigma factor (TIGR02999 family)